jgi:hypothetical protein
VKNHQLTLFPRPIDALSSYQLVLYTSDFSENGSQLRIMQPLTVNVSNYTKQDSQDYKPVEAQIEAVSRTGLVTIRFN